MVLTAPQLVDDDNTPSVTTPVQSHGGPVDGHEALTMSVSPMVDITLPWMSVIKSIEVPS
jgi:hypothetical protein